jgi:hypothetical protein
MIAAAVARHLSTRIVGLRYDPVGKDGNVFVAFMPDRPNIAVAVMPTGGLPQMTKDPDDQPGVQIIVRGDRNMPRASYELARDIYGELTCLDLVTLDEGGDDEVFVVGCTALQSDPVPMGQDSNQRHEWSLNFGLHTHAPTLNRT